MMLKEYYENGYIYQPSKAPWLPPKTKLDFKSAMTHLTTLLIKATDKFDLEKKTIVLLSGGLDSSTSAWLANCKDALTITYYDFPTKDIQYAFDVAKYLNYNLIDYKLKIDDFWNAFSIYTYGGENIMQYFHLPIAESGIFPLYYAYKKCKKLGYKQIITGDGGDETCLGYKWDRLSFIKKDIPRWEIQHHLFSKHVYIAETLSKAVGIKILSPFLDKDVIEFLYSLPTSYKVSPTRNKIILRETMRGKIPFVDRPKYYFHNPFNVWANVKGKKATREWFLNKWIESRT